MTNIYREGSRTTLDNIQDACSPYLSSARYNLPQLAAVALQRCQFPLVVFLVARIPNFRARYESGSVGLNKRSHPLKTPKIPAGTERRKGFMPAHFLSDIFIKPGSMSSSHTLLPRVQIHFIGDQFFSPIRRLLHLTDVPFTSLEPNDYDFL